MNTLPLLITLLFPGAPASAAAPAQQPRRAPVWHESWDAAAAAARKLPEGRVLVEFVDEGCGECVRLEGLILPAPSFATFVTDKALLRLKLSSTEGKDLASRFGIRSVPAWLILTPDDEILAGVQVGTTNQAGWFDTFAKTEQSWAAYKKKLLEEAKNPGDVKLVFEVATETFRRGGDTLAEPRFRRLSKEPKATPEIRQQSLAYLASIELDSNRVDEAARDLDQLLKIVTDPMLRERAELRRADVEIARGRKDKAVDLLREFKKAHPGSPAMKDVDQLLKQLESNLTENKER